MTPADRSFHNSMKPSWGPDGTLVYAASSPQKFQTSRGVRERDGLLVIQKGGIVSEKRDVHFAKFSNEAAAYSLKKYMALAIIEDGDVPRATLPSRFQYSLLVADTSSQQGAAPHENLAWQLASILWDDIEIPVELQAVPNVEQRMRKDNLSAFWERLVESASNQHAGLARSAEEKAIACLSGHKIQDACGHLLEGKDYHLATLVSMIGSKESSRMDIQEQLDGWKKSDVLTEFSQPIRTIYELLAGNVCVCEGVKSSHENRIDAFSISKRFGLDWRQAFGLRLWYETLATDSIDAAVMSFDNDIMRDLEPNWPSPWYVEQKIQPLWEDDLVNDRQDLLYGLLKLFTYDNADTEAAICPENCQLSPLDNRMTWQLGRALTTLGSGSGLSDEAADQMTLSFASQLVNEGSWIESIFVLLHLSENDTRAKAIQNNLAQHANHIGAEDSDTFKRLTQSLKIPASWIWEAKALFMRSVKKDPRAEVDCLIKAGSFEEAHRTFTKEVAPKTIIERDYDALRTLLTGFEGMENSIPEWHLGGEIYYDFLDLLASQKSGKGADDLLLQRLLAGLPAVVQDSRGAGFLETVAIEEISGVVAKVVAMRGVKSEVNFRSYFPDLSPANSQQKAKIMSLPLTEDRYLKHTIELSLGYYREVMAGGK
jgi:nuclear pore complex protein Nup98-Nup96